MANLKSCPFCGGTENDALTMPFEDRFTIFCKCGCQMASAKWDRSGFETIEEVFAAWNRRASGWIPVSERLPGRGEIVLVAGNGEQALATCEEEVWETDHGEIEPPTHWQPLPDPPEVSDD